MLHCAGNGKHRVKRARVPDGLLHCIDYFSWKPGAL
jgi:hypothetical protein